MEEIIEQVKAWPFLQQLPARKAGFSLHLDLTVDGTLYNIFSYSNPDEVKSFSVVYDAATKDYLARVMVGLNEFYDISFICTDLAVLEKNLTTKLGPALLELSGERHYESIVVKKNILDWPYGAKLPGEVAGFRLFITPRQPLKVINGSYVIIDYSDFAIASDLTINYNVFRDEFFGELRLKRTPHMTTDFDTRELDELAAKLDSGLEPALLDLRARVTAAEGGSV